ncbi:hypothetical protein RUND412_010629 [Rhizina undulata]
MEKQVFPTQKHAFKFFLCQRTKLTEMRTITGARQFRARARELKSARHTGNQHPKRSIPTSPTKSNDSQQTSVANALPAISKNVGAGNALGWVGSSFLIANTAGLAVWGRLSDIFGRKNVLLISILLFAVANLLCGFSTNLAELLAFRVLSGFGGGGISVLGMIIMSDIVSLKNRGAILGYVAMGASLGVGIGPLLGGVFSQTDCRWVFWVICPPATIGFVQIWIWLPLKPVEGAWREKVNQIDFAGIFLLILATVFIMVPISGGGSTYPWSSPLVITLLILGVVALAAFGAVEHYHAKIPIIPLRIFKNWSMVILTFLSVGNGFLFYPAIYYVPEYLQHVKHYSSIHSGVILLALIMPQVATVVATGYILSWRGRYQVVLIAGYTTYLIAVGLEITFDTNTTLAKIVGILFLQGFGLGCTTQTGLVAMQANSEHADRAVVTGVRNVGRILGGAIGISVCQGLLTSRIPGGEFGTFPEGLDPEQEAVWTEAYSRAFKAVWYWLLAVAVAQLLAGVFVKEVRLRGDEVLKKPEPTPGNADLEAAAKNETEEKK